MDRRAFIGTLAGGLLAARLAAEAQQAAKIARIGFLVQGSGPVTRISSKDCAISGTSKVAPS